MISLSFKLYYSAFFLYSYFTDEVVELAPSRNRNWKDDIPSKGLKHSRMEPNFFPIIFNVLVILKDIWPGISNMEPLFRLPVF